MKNRYRGYHDKPGPKKIRNARSKARAILTRYGLVCKGDGKIVKFMDGNPLNTDPDNLYVFVKKEKVNEVKQTD